LYQAFKAGADAVGGGMSNGTPWSVTGSTAFYLEFFHFLAFRGEPREARFLVGGNSGFRRSLLLAERYNDHSESEDMLFCWRLAQQGKKLVFVPNASVQHLNRTGFRNVFRYQRKLGRGAYVYRSQDTPQLVKLLKAAPPLVFLTPFAVMGWIATTILGRRRFGDFLRFICVLPACFVANFAWAFGFYRAGRHGVPEASPLPLLARAADE
jgi:cellulose synthase/poly-beta-1,6-N-acetylglucosamine synthase-like glycosyltransferase